MHKKILLIICTAFGGCVWTAAYMACASSDAYQKASDFTSSNATIYEKTGKILKSRLAYYNFKVSENLIHGNAEFTVVISGEKADADVWFLLTKASSGWIVRKAALSVGKENLVLSDNP